MNKPSNYAKNVTLIEDLPDAEEMNDYSQSQQPDNKYQKFIRNDHKTPSESGMNPRQNQNIPTQQPQYNQQEYFVNPNYYEPFKQPNNSHVNCRDLVEHYENCPLCSKFFKSDYTLYIIIIILLSITVIILLKKVLNI
jgi:hypothetical protein